MSETTTNVPTLNFNGQNYPIADLSDVAKAQLQNLQVAEAEILRLKNQLALIEAAKASFVNVLKNEIAKQGIRDDL